ncbi:hypothetical protein [Mycobacterium leprae]|uniref:hypothetical protein n=1 Tax=Mycobacterium leprae TaxID=1769 RepID=UPI000A5682AD|nr:hypothetical protein [Mycobacterium leprae]
MLVANKDDNVVRFTVTGGIVAANANSACPRRVQPPHVQCRRLRHQHRFRDHLPNPAITEANDYTGDCKPDTSPS